MWAVRANIAVLRLGIPIGSQHLLSIVGRTSGRLRSTPISVVTVDGGEYLVSAFAHADWVANARAVGSGTLRRGRTSRRVRLVELSVDEREPILRAFLRQVPGGVRFFAAGHDPGAVAAAAADYPVFRVDPAEP